ncbi:hypothetical protein LENED_011373 [Lentinula edodes]|uniref:Uncharacterized protein n=1 Tax=Lentinula edodes TaxID=5353 RepID=A0A1Q3EPU7_LENED|nr:hypothetical protein LENED_011373 [Lentinula edodes]
MSASSIDEYGRDLVHGQIWSRCGLVDLIQHVCWKGSEPSFDTHPLSVALLAFSVYNHFKTIGDQKNASTFTGILQRCVKGYFEALWDVENKGSALRFTPDSSFAPEYIQSLVAVTQQQLSSVPNIQRTTNAILRLVTEQSGCSMDVLQ